MLERRLTNHRHPLYRRDDCWFADTAVEFRNVWRVHFKVEIQTEQVRQRLQRNPHYSMREAFESLDLNLDGSVSAKEVKRVVGTRGFYVSEKDA